MTHGWFLQNLGKDFIPTDMHTTVSSMISSVLTLKYSIQREVNMKGKSDVSIYLLSFHGTVVMSKDICRKV